jgi:diguanylate cyclase (GGDEF)-like protein
MDMTTSRSRCGPPWIPPIRRAHPHTAGPRTTRAGSNRARPARTRSARVRRALPRRLGLGVLLGIAAAGSIGPVWLTPVPAAAQELPVIHYGTKEGLASVFVIALAQGPDGRLWIAHGGGISSYDGSEFRAWRRRDGLLGHSPYSIVVDPGGTVWFAFPDRGVQYMGRDGVVHTVPDPDGLAHSGRISSLQLLRDGSVVSGGTDGWYRITRQRIDGPHDPTDGAPGWVFSVLDAGGRWGRLYAVETGVWSVRDGRKERLPLPYEEIGSREIYAMALGNGGEAWFLSSNGRLVRGERPDGDDWRTWDLTAGTEGLESAFFDLQMDPVGNLWIATGIGLFRCREGRVERFTEEEGLSNIWVSDVCVDREGILWLATESGLDKISQMAFRNYRYHRDFPVNAVWPMLERPDGSIWIGTNAGLVVIDTTGRSRVITGKDGLPEPSIVDMEAGRDGRVWILSYNGVHRWDEGGFFSYPTEPLEGMELWGILPVPDEGIWILTSDGILLLDPGSGTFAPHPVNDRIDGGRDLSDIVLSRSGDVFIVGTRVYRYRAGDVIEEIAPPPSLSGPVIFTVVEEEDRLWLLTDSGLLETDGKRWTAHPLEETAIAAMVPLGGGEYWLGGTAGIIRFDGTDYSFFGHHDGVAVEECASDAALIDRAGRVWFGGKNITIVIPEEIRPQPAGTPLVTRVETGGGTVSLPDAVRIPSHEKSLEIHYSTPSFFNEQEQVYRYRMRGLEAGWSTPTRDRSVRYAGLPPGRYEFEVQSRQAHGDWDAPAARLPVEILPAFWQTTAAKAVGVLLLIACGFLVGLTRVRRVEAQRRHLRLRVREQTRQIRAQRDELARLATIDSLTGLPNRRKFAERLETELLRARRYGRPLSLLLFDVDRFKSINDTFGHAAGDRILRRIAARGREAIREIDFLARWGGDEFVLLMPETDGKGAMETCARIKAAVEALPTEPGGAERGDVQAFTISGGIATWHDLDSDEGDGDPGKAERGAARNPDDEELHGASASIEAEALFEAADAALYRAKRAGGNRISA